MPGRGGSQQCRDDVRLRRAEVEPSGEAACCADAVDAVGIHDGVEVGVGVDRGLGELGFGCVAAPIGNPGEAVAVVSVCGPMNRMMFDQRLAAPVRMTAMSIWRNVEDGPQRVAPTLQPLRPLLPRRPASAAQPALQYA